MQVTVITLTPTTVHACHLGMEWTEPSPAEPSRAEPSQAKSSRAQQIWAKSRWVWLTQSKDQESSEAKTRWNLTNNRRCDRAEFWTMHSHPHHRTCMSVAEPSRAWSSQSKDQESSEAKARWNLTNNKTCNGAGFWTQISQHATKWIDLQGLWWFKLLF